MSLRLIDKLTQENLCTYFVLPLIGLNKLSFLSGNFIESYIIRPQLSVTTTTVQQGFTYIVVEIVLLDFVSPRFYKTNPYFVEYFTVEESNYLQYYIPPAWENDVELFMEGKFSKMSNSAKEKIRGGSGLPYNAMNEKGGIETDGRLLALDRNIQLRQMWERELLITLTEDSELLSIPDERSYKDNLLIGTA